MAELPTDGHILAKGADAEACKICYGGNEEASNPLITPCLCAGSMRHVHSDCLVQWIKTAALKRCDLCRYPFTLESKTKPLKEWEMVELRGDDKLFLVTLVIIDIICLGMAVYITAKISLGLLLCFILGNLFGLLLVCILDVMLRYDIGIYYQLCAIFQRFKSQNSYVKVTELQQRKLNTSTKNRAKEEIIQD